MLVRDAVQSRVSDGPARLGDGPDVELPLRLKPDRLGVKVRLLRRLSSARAFSLGQQAGVLRNAQNRSGCAFRPDVRQRVIVKALVSRHAGRGAERSAALARHLTYLGRAGAGVEGARPEFFDRHADGLEVADVGQAWATDRHHFRFIISPEHGDRMADLKGYVRDVMGRVTDDLGQGTLTWIGTCHFDTDQPHAHVLVRGRRADGKDLVIPRDYMGYGFRARAQEAAQERLGDLSRVDAERRIWRETQADRFTGFDRRLLGAASDEGLVADAQGGTDAWSALLRGRLRHLETLGLAARVGRHYRLDGALETRLRQLQIRRDVIRTMNQCRLEGGTDVRLLGLERIHGRVSRSGFHDELGASPWAIVRTTDGTDYYAHMRPGTRVPSQGASIVLEGRPGGLAELVTRPRGSDLER
jgi:type IV secretory pathway VirD2 relaxase